MRKLFLFIGLVCCSAVLHAANYHDLNIIAQDRIFEGRVGYALETAAIAVLNEAPETASHAQRVNFAKRIIEGAINTYIITLGVLTNATIATEANVSATDFAIPDADIQFSINSIFNALAGVSS